MVDIGAHRLKGVMDTVRMYHVRSDGLGWVDQPLVSTRELAVLLTRRGQAARAGVLWGYPTGHGLDMTPGNAAQQSAESVTAVHQLPDADAIVTRGAP